MKLFIWQATTFVGMALCLESSVFGQTLRSFVGSYHASIPNPEANLVDICYFATNKSVAKEIKLTDDSIKKLEDLKNASGGSLTALKYSGEVREDLLAAALQAKRFESTARVNAILNPFQITRLRELLYQIEIERVGLAEALTDGFCGKAIGINDFQKPALRIRAETIDKKSANELTAIAEFTMRDMELTAEQLSDVRKCLGIPFFFRNVKSGLPRGRTPDPDSILETVHLLKDDTIAVDVRLQTSDREEILRLLTVSEDKLLMDKAIKIRDQNRKFEIIEMKTEIANERISRIAEILDPLQRDRLKEIAYRFEVDKVGIILALTDGFLGKRVGMNKNQIVKLRLRAEKIESKIRDAVTDVKTRSRSELFRELEPLQRIEVEKVLGKPFAFRE